MNFSYLSTFNYSQADFAEYVEISRPTVGFYENGERVPDALIIKKIADKCNVSADWLLGLSDIRSSDANIQTIGKHTGLSDEAITNLKWLSEEYIEPPILQEIKDKLYKIHVFMKKFDAGILKEHPGRVTDDELKVYNEYLQNEVNKKNLKTINLLLSSMDGLLIINCMASYFDIKPDTQTTMQTEEAGTALVCDSDMLSGMYSQAAIAKMQELRNKIREEHQPNE